jgi:mannose-6-phosphate isomerase-like protein (cupin superfamily)
MENETNTSSSIEKLEELQLGKTSKLKLFVWRTRRGLRDVLKGKDVLDVESKSASNQKVREVYRAVDNLMSKHFPGLVSDTPVDVARKMVHDKIVELGHTIVEEDMTKPWGAYYRMDGDEAERFIGEFFPGLSLAEAKLGRDGVELSPKFLLVSPGERLSWQYHDRRAERWRFLTGGAYYRSHSDEQGELIAVPADTIVQFDAGERHRLCAGADNASYTLVAEIWQHTKAGEPSDESDIVRLHDDYQR